ncbi:MAG: hypothetical protein H0V76_11305 [Blastocatellia bacterium]|nr:hypothetical protein [Blastocatellia bacterium]
MIGLAALIAGCSGQAHGPDFVFVERHELDSETRAEGGIADPLALIVSVNPTGKLMLNRVDVGTIDDADALSQRLATIFSDRKRADINKRDVVVELDGKIESKVLYQLLDRLHRASASPLRVTMVSNRPK